MSRHRLISTGLALLGLAALAYSAMGGNPPALPKTGSEPPSGTDRHMILAGAELDSGAPYALMLHPLATGGDLRAVTDQGALRKAQPKAFYIDKTGAAETRLHVQTPVLRSPVGAQDSSFATLIRVKEEIRRFTCHTLPCNGKTNEDAPPIRDLAGLVEASRPITLITESFALPEKARAAHFRALRDDSIVLIEPPNLPPPGRVSFPARVRLDLPPVLLDTDETGTRPLPPFDEAEYRARFVAAFTHAYPETDAYRLGEISFTHYSTPRLGWPVVSDEFEGYLLDEQDELRGINRIIMLEPRLTIDLTPRLTKALLGPDPFEHLPDFSREPETLEPRLDALAEEVLGRPCPGCFRIELPVGEVDAIKVTRSEPPTYTLSYYRIADHEPSAQQ